MIYKPVDEDEKAPTLSDLTAPKPKTETPILAINTHQPLDGPTSWYEAHLCSEEGTDIIGSLFAGSPSILIGANKNIAWAHTVNKPDKTDVF